MGDSKNGFRLQKSVKAGLFQELTISGTYFDKNDSYWLLISDLLSVSLTGGLNHIAEVYRITNSLHLLAQYV